MWLYVHIDIQLPAIFVNAYLLVFQSKFFGVKGTGKDGTLRSNSAPLSWTDLQNSLEHERSKNHRLQEQIKTLDNERKLCVCDVYVTNYMMGLLWHHIHL